MPQDLVLAVNQFNQFFTERVHAFRLDETCIFQLALTLD